MIATQEQSAEVVRIGLRLISTIEELGAPFLFADDGVERRRRGVGRMLLNAAVLASVEAGLDPTNVMEGVFVGLGEGLAQQRPEIRAIVIRLMNEAFAAGGQYAAAAFTPRGTA